MTCTTLRRRVASWPRLVAMPTLLLAAAGCAPDRMTGPSSSVIESVKLEGAAPGALASFGDTVTLLPRVLDRAGRTVAGVTPRYTLSASNILAPLGNGRFEAIGNGRVTVFVRVDSAQTGVVPGGYYVGTAVDSVQVTVQQVAVSLSIMAADSNFAAVGEARPLLVRLTDARGNAMTSGFAALTYSAADSNVVVVDGAGTLRSVRDGSTQVVVRSGALSAARTYSVSASRAHTSCMSYVRRRKARTSCVTVGFVLHPSTSVTP